MKRTAGIALAAILTLTALSGCQSAARSDSTSPNPSALPATALPSEEITHAGAGELRVGTLSFQLISSDDKVVAEVDYLSSDEAVETLSTAIGTRPAVTEVAAPDLATHEKPYTVYEWDGISLSRTTGANVSPTEPFRIRFTASKSGKIDLVTSDGVRVGDSAAYVLRNVPGATRTHPEAAEIGPLAFFLNIVEQPSFDENSPPGTIAVSRATIAVIAASGDVIEQIYAPEDLSGP